MTEDSGFGGSGLPGAGDVPEVVLRERSGISLIWLIPAVAILIGGWITWRAISEQGPTVTITFQSAEGQVQLRRHTLRTVERETSKRLATLVRAGKA